MFKGSPLCASPACAARSPLPSPVCRPPVNGAPVRRELGNTAASRGPAWHSAQKPPFPRDRAPRRGVRGRFPFSISCRRHVGSRCRQRAERSGPACAGRRGGGREGRLPSRAGSICGGGEAGTIRPHAMAGARRDRRRQGGGGCRRRKARPGCARRRRAAVPHAPYPPPHAFGLQYARLPEQSAQSAVRPPQAAQAPARPPGGGDAASQGRTCPPAGRRQGRARKARPHSAGKSTRPHAAHGL